MVVDKEAGSMALLQWIQKHPTLPRKIGELIFGLGVKKNLDC